MSLPFATETSLEARICADPAFQAGVWWGAPRPGHPEGTVAAHIVQVLANIDRGFHTDARRSHMRLAALVHDTFKYQVDPTVPRAGQNHHGKRARDFLAAYSSDEQLLELVELHDEAYNAWGVGARRGDWSKARWRAGQLLDRLGTPDAVSEYVDFYAADNQTGTKTPESWEWFAALAAELAS